MSPQASTVDNHSATISAILGRYRTLGNHNWERMTDQLVALDPRLPRAGAELLAHNWHTCNPASPIRAQINAVREQRSETSRKLYARQKSECDRAEHARHIRDAQAGRYLWCEPCQEPAVELARRGAPPMAGGSDEAPDAVDTWLADCTRNRCPQCRRMFLAGNDYCEWCPDPTPAPPAPAGAPVQCATCGKLDGRGVTLDYTTTGWECMPCRLRRIDTTPKEPTDANVPPMRAPNGLPHPLQLRVPVLPGLPLATPAPPAPGEPLRPNVAPTLAARGLPPMAGGSGESEIPGPAFWQSSLATKQCHWAAHLECPDPAHCGCPCHRPAPPIAGGSGEPESLPSPGPIAGPGETLETPTVERAIMALRCYGCGDVISMGTYHVEQYSMDWQAIFRWCNRCRPLPMAGGSGEARHAISIQVIGEIWQPGVGPCAMDLTTHCTELLGGFTRDSVQDWLDCHAGDFQTILDFTAIHGPEEIPWADEESEMLYNDAMDPMPESDWH